MGRVWTTLDSVLALALRQALIFIFSALFISCAGFVVGHPVSRFYLPAAFLLAIASNRWPMAPPAGAMRIRVAASFLLSGLIATCVGLSSCFLDFSSDGNTYHLVSIIGLRDGWNPIWTHRFVDWAHASNLYAPQVIDDLYEAGMWTDHYPKASWILSAVVLTWVAKIACAGWVQLFVAVIAAFSFRQALRWAELTPGWATALALGAALSPVVLAQFFTNYVDGLLGSCLLIEASLLLSAHISGRTSHTLEAGIAAVVASDLKFTGLLYAVLLLACFLIVSKPLRRTFLELWRYRPVSSCAGVAAVAVICWNPYFTNLLIDGHPFHPIQQINVMHGQADPEFLERGRWIKFLGASTGALSPRAESNTFPFWAERPAVWRYLQSISEADPLKQGYGPHFIAILLLALGIGAGAAWQLARTRRKSALALLALVYLMWIASCMLVNPEFWWARFLPQLWVVPFVMCALAVATKRLVAGIALATPLIVSISIFGFCFVVLIGKKLQMEHRASDVWQSSRILRVADTPNNSHRFFVAAAIAAEHGMRVETVSGDECRVIKLPMISACAPEHQD